MYDVGKVIFVCLYYALITILLEGDLSKIKITTLESAGVLEYSSNGSSWADVTLNQEKLKFLSNISPKT